MDDTLWIANSKNELKLITDMASSFYHMADTQINPIKSILVSNTSSNNELSFFASSIKPIPASQPFKFLRCWFTLNGSMSKQNQIIQDEATQLINIISTKKITSKQAAYIIN